MGLIAAVGHVHHCPRPECGKTWTHKAYSCSAGAELECPEHPEPKSE